MATTAMTTDLLTEFGEAWNRHDADLLMEYMADDCRRQLADWHDLHLAVLFPPTFQLEPDEILANHRGLIETFAA